jgi:hypothetical protein
VSTPIKVGEGSAFTPILGRIFLDTVLVLLDWTKHRP